jgi:hypothetical protein
MYINAKMILVESFPGNMVGGDERVVMGVNSSMIYLINCKNLCRCYHVPPLSTTIKKIKIK